MKRAYFQQSSQCVEVGYDTEAGCLRVSLVKDSLGKDQKIVPLGCISLAEFLVDERVPLAILEEAISRAQGIDGYPETAVGLDSSIYNPSGDATLDGLPADSPKRQTEIEGLIQTGEPPSSKDNGGVTGNGNKSNLEVI